MPMLAKQYMVKVFFPPVTACREGRPADEWHAKHWAFLDVPPGRTRFPKNSCPPLTSEAVSVYRFCAGTPKTEASYFELNWLTSGEFSNAAINAPTRM